MVRSHKRRSQKWQSWRRLRRRLKRLVIIAGIACAAAGIGVYLTMEISTWNMTSPFEEDEARSVR